MFEMCGRGWVMFEMCGSGWVICNVWEWVGDMFEMCGSGWVMCLKCVGVGG